MSLKLKNKNCSYINLSSTAVILAGGKSSRMGFDKQFLEINNVRVIDLLVKELKKQFEEVIVVTNKVEKYNKSDYKVISDEIKDCGPLGGIHIGLKNSSSKYTYFIACDMPNINLDYIKFMKNKIENLKVDACITKSENGKMEVFNGFYSKEVIGVIEKQILERKLAIRYLIDNVNAVYIEEKEARDYNDTLDMFTNLNTQEELNTYTEKLKMEYSKE
ncbi:molybdenum cofactor guanylyltransferase [Clostridium botulinum]|nr:molybdenum cofactor guanylyltransferase [Clostridium botulinum]